MEQQNYSNPMPEKYELQNGTMILVMGILSIVFCWCGGIVGVILGVIALIMANKSMAQFATNPNPDAWSNYGNVKAGRICAIIGLILSVLYLIYMIVLFAVMGTGAMEQYMNNLR